MSEKLLHDKKTKGERSYRAVGLFAYFEWVSVSTSVLNTAKYLASQGYEVDLFMIQNERFDIPVFDYDNIHVYTIRRSRFSTGYLKFALKYFFRPRNYSFLIGFDPDGLIIAGIQSILWRVPYVYHSLELFSISIKGNYPQILKKMLERFFAQRASLSLSQDEKRAEILSISDGIDKKKMGISYNSPMGNILSSKSSYLRDKCKIPREKIIVLAVGSLIVEHLIDSIIRSVDNWTDEFVLVVHGWIPYPDYEALLRYEIGKRKERVFLSTDVLSDNEKYKVFQSADVGLVFFDPIDDNFTYAAGSAGKIFDFMRVGVPMIANELPGMRELIEENGCGIVVRSVDTIGKALPNIMQEYDLYRKAAHMSYEKFRFDVCYERILDRIVSIVSDRS